MAHDKYTWNVDGRNALLLKVLNPSIFMKRLKKNPSSSETHLRQNNEHLRRYMNKKIQ